MDEKLVELFVKWLKAFEAVSATKENDVNAALVSRYWHYRFDREFAAATPGLEPPSLV